MFQASVGSVATKDMVAYLSEKITNPGDKLLCEHITSITTVACFNSRKGVNKKRMTADYSWYEPMEKSLGLHLKFINNVVDKVLQKVPSKQSAITFLSLGAGGMLDAALIQFLINKEGYRSVKWRLIDTRYERLSVAHQNFRNYFCNDMEIFTDELSYMYKYLKVGNKMVKMADNDRTTGFTVCLFMTPDYSYYSKRSVSSGLFESFEKVALVDANAGSSFEDYEIKSYTGFKDFKDENNLSYEGVYAYRRLLYNFSNKKKCPALDLYSDSDSDSDFSLDPDLDSDFFAASNLTSLANSEVKCLRKTPFYLRGKLMFTDTESKPDFRRLLKANSIYFFNISLEKADERLSDAMQEIQRRKLKLEQKQNVKEVHENIEKLVCDGISDSCKDVLRYTINGSGFQIEFSDHKKSRDLFFHYLEFNDILFQMKIDFFSDYLKNDPEKRYENKRLEKLFTDFVEKYKARMSDKGESVDLITLATSDYDISAKNIYQFFRKYKDKADFFMFRNN